MKTCVVVAILSALCNSVTLGWSTQRVLQKDQVPGKFDSRRILCPVLASLHNEGDLVPDSDGSVETQDLYEALHDVLGQPATLALEQAIGIADFDEKHKLTQDYRDRCWPGKKCFFEQRLGVASAKRYLNIFEMSGLEVAEHGASTGVRGGNTNVPDFSVDGEGFYPSESRFKEFYETCADNEGNFYEENIKCIACSTLITGDRGGEWAYNPNQGGRQWHVYAALQSMLQVFGRLPKNGKASDPGTHLTMSDMRRLVMDGKYPEGWEKRVSGNAFTLINAARADLKCDQKAMRSPWAGPKCPLDTGVSCDAKKSVCPVGSVCVSGQCLCGKHNATLISMCFKDGACTPREDTCKYFGEKCKRTAANNPSAPW